MKDILYKIDMNVEKLKMAAAAFSAVSKSMTELSKQVRSVNISMDALVKSVRPSLKTRILRRLGWLL